MAETPSSEGKIIASVADEVKKLSYLGAAGPYLVLGDEAKTVIGGGTMVAIAMVWFIMCQAVAHGLIALAERMAEQDD